MAGAVVFMEAVRVERIGGFELMILTETNIIDKAYCQNNMGYDVVFLEAHTTSDGNAQGGVGIIF